ncbi:MAG: 2-oxoglutarate dehydrogenase E1 component [Petrimonas sp.]|nr:2-oxoglutarate dehydrogenase E1 component [Petrimonas sp.]MDD4014322.1 2-oxoglutarate dehydrogenase E1 component [Petrimonas sp.]MDD4535374.1 2-oxoglutarate dehydrogenase E1 component [Petrimonas sp.]
MDTRKELNFMDIGAIEELYKQYMENPESVDESFRFFFQGFDLATRHFPAKPQEIKGDVGVSTKEIAVMNLITGYRRRGHLFTKTNPVRSRRQYSPTLDLDNFNLSESDLDKEFEAGKEIGIGRATLREIVEHLSETYCKSIGVEYRYMTKPEIVQWLQQKMESSRNQETLPNEKKLHILNNLIEASGFEDYMHRKYVGQKRFSLEGSETIIPALDAIVSHGGSYDVNDIVIGMAHRGRLNVLTNIMKKPYSQVFRGFTAENYEEEIKYGDVKYHLGYNNTIDYEGRKISVSLAPNPSHLEAVGPVVEGIAKAKLEQEHDFQYNQVLPILIHGDAAIAGQGVVYETIQFSKLDGYKTGGTIHIVINNQVGFTTNYLQGRSSTYCTDVAKVTQSPVFHVNGDDVEAMVFVAKLALEFRQKFNIDVFIDLLSYRKYGHNEGDEPRFTQPKLYDIIAKHKNPREIYAGKLISQGVLTQLEYETRVADFHKVLDQAYETANESTQLNIQLFLEEKYKGIRFPKAEDFETIANTKISKEMFLELAEKITSLPKDKHFYNKTVRLFSQRAGMIKDDSYDWAMGELMAYASLAKENYPVRLSGQDSERGTFSHRHAEIITEDGEEKYFPLKNLGGEHAMVRVYNSPLNEYGVLGFEYGYSLANPFGLTIWEAQFGDFFNVGQVIVDQYISAAQEKWGVKSGLVMFLPHGYEGQGAEHSSGRIERFLNLCANFNMQVVNPTTPANHFHAIRRQLHRDIRVPLIAFTPKSLLRHPDCTSTIADFTEGHFQEIIADNSLKSLSKATKLLLCSGKIYYELDAARKEANADHLSIIRIEQLYPFPAKQLQKILKNYSKDIKLVWVQEEPLNMGAALFVKHWIGDRSLQIISRPSSGVTAEGLTALHKIHQAEIIKEAIQ